MRNVDAKIIAVMGDGARTYQIASKIGWDTGMTRRVMRRLECEGKVKRDAHSSAVNDIRWIPGDAA